MTRITILRRLRLPFSGHRPVRPQCLDDFAYGDVYLPDHLLRDVGLLDVPFRRRTS